MKPPILAILALLCLAPAARAVETYTMVASWSSDARFLATGAQGVWALRDSPGRIYHYDQNGTELAAWDVPSPDGGPSLAGGIGVDGNGLVYSLIFNTSLGEVVQVMQEDGVLVDSRPVHVGGTGGFGVDASGGVHLPPEDYQLLAVSPNGTEYKVYSHEVYIGGPAGPDFGICYTILGDPKLPCFDGRLMAAATDDKMCMGAFWHDASGDDVAEVRVWDQHTLIGSFGSHTQPDGLAFGADLSIYYLVGGTIQRWQPAAATPTAAVSWGAVRARWK